VPAKSVAQRNYLYMKFGKAWVKKHHFDTKGDLPDHVSRVAKHKMSTRSAASSPGKSKMRNKRGR
jgi:hypothetical protein